MTLLQKVLRLQAAIWSVCGLAVATAPHWVLVSLFDQTPYPDYTYVRISGAMAIGFCLLAVLVAQKIEDLWWWTWAFAITDAAVATITGVNALIVGTSDHSVSRVSTPGTLGFAVERPGVVLWWLFAGVNAVLAAGLLLGLGRAGQEKPFT